MGEPGTRKGPGSLCVNPHLFIPAAGHLFRRVPPVLANTGEHWIKRRINAKILVCVCARHAFVHARRWPRHGHHPAGVRSCASVPS